MRIVRWVGVLVLSVASWGLGEVAWGATSQTLNSELAMPLGRLGYPYGTYLTIEAQTINAGVYNAMDLLVKSVNGHKFATPVRVKLGIFLHHRIFPDDVSVVIHGYEWGSLKPVYSQNEAEGQVDPAEAVDWETINIFHYTSRATLDEIKEPVGPPPRLPAEDEDPKMPKNGDAPSIFCMPYGSEITIEGNLLSSDDEEQRLFIPHALVHSANGIRLPVPVIVPLMNVRYTGKGAPCILKGSETTLGKPSKNLPSKHALDGRVQAITFHRQFRVTEVIEPQDAKTWDEMTKP